MVHHGGKVGNMGSVVESKTKFQVDLGSNNPYTLCFGKELETSYGGYPGRSEDYLEVEVL